MLSGERRSSLMRCVLQHSEWFHPLNRLFYAQINRRSENAIVPPDLSFPPGQEPTLFRWQGEQDVGHAIAQIVNLLPSEDVALEFVLSP